MARKSRHPRRAVLSAALAAASWSEADVALAQAWADFGEFAARSQSRSGLVKLVGQSLARAARLRSLSLIGAPGETAAYDVSRHELIAAARRAPALVRIVAPGVARGEKVLLKARVRTARGDA